MATALRARSTWRQVVYHLVAGPALALAALAAIGLWLAGLLYGAVYLYGWALPDGLLLQQATYPHRPVTLPDLPGPSAGVYLTVGGLAALFAAPWVSSAVAALDARAGRALLGPSRAEELAHRVELLTRTRAGVVDAVAYFAVSEGLANIVKHAQATEAAVHVERSGDRLHVASA